MTRLDGCWPQLTVAGVTTAPPILDVNPLENNNTGNTEAYVRRRTF